MGNKSELKAAISKLSDLASDMNSFLEKDKSEIKDNLFTAEILSVKYLAGEVLIRVADNGEVPQSFSSGDLVTICKLPS